MTASVDMHKYWLQAQHNTGHTHVAATLQHKAHNLASVGAACAKPFTAPLLPLLNRAILATSERRLLFNIRLSVTRHDVSLVRAASREASWDTVRWSAGDFTSLLLDSALPRAPLVTALRLRALLFRPPPPRSQYTITHATFAHVDSPWAHVAHSCPVFLLRTHWAFVRLLTTLPKQAGLYLPDSTTLVLPAAGVAVALALETDAQVLTPLQPHRTTVYSPSGLVRDPAQRASRDQVRIILEMMIDPTRDLFGLLLVLDALEFPTRPHPSLNPHVSVLTSWVVLPLSVAFLASWVTCHLQDWRMVAGGELPMRMPPPPPPGGPSRSYS